MPVCLPQNDHDVDDDLQPCPDTPPIFSMLLDWYSILIGLTVALIHVPGNRCRITMQT